MSNPFPIGSERYNNRAIRLAIKANGQTMIEAIQAIRLLQRGKSLPEILKFLERMRNSV